MLCLKRKTGEQVVIGDSVVTVVECRRGCVRLGIEAMKDVRIVRGELVAKRVPEKGRAS